LDRAATHTAHSGRLNTGHANLPTGNNLATVFITSFRFWAQADLLNRKIASPLLL